ncbi:MAG: 3-isopropylmalate dehydratase small subunit [Blastocatellia bacterium]|nr:3-isopropylmalate dehydratase small subunit [Blastocatellia bacterium]
MKRFEKFSSKSILLPTDNIDTDQIIPARFLKITDKSDLGKNLFADWRYSSSGELTDFVLNRSENQQRKILITGDNFGCGSSREHAPWALVGYGLRAIVSTSFADIFRNNALKNHLLLITLEPSEYSQILATISSSPETEFTVDLAEQKLSFDRDSKEYSFHFPIDQFSKRCMMEGLDELGMLLSYEKEVANFEARLPVYPL